MSDSSIALKPVIDDPSKPIPSSSAPAISPGVIANDFRCPSMSVNQKRTDWTPSSWIRLTTSLRAPSSLVARARDSTCAICRSPLAIRREQRNLTEFRERAGAPQRQDGDPRREDGTAVTREERLG